MKVVVFHGSPRKGNTYLATTLFMDELRKCGDIEVTEFFLPKDMPEFCTGCQLCLGNTNDRCPHARYVAPILDAILKADALVLTTPHFGACSMSGGMKNLLDHLDFLTMNVSPRSEIFGKKAFILTTGSGSTAAGKPIKSYLKNWGVNRVYTCGIRMFTDKWLSMPNAKQQKLEHQLRKAARHFYASPRKSPYRSTVLMYYMSRFILKRYVGAGNYPFEYWKEKGYFTKRPF